MYLTTARSLAFGARTPWYRWRWTRPTLRVGARRDEASEPLDKLNWRQQELGAAVGRRLGQLIDEPGLGRTERDDAAGRVEPFQRERRSSTVSEQPFDACPVLALDADGRVDAEPTGALPRQHTVGVGFVEQAVRAEVAQHATLDDVLECVPVLGSESGGLMEADLPIDGP